MYIWWDFFSTSRRSDRVYLGWFVWDSVGKLFRMQGSRQSVKAHYGFSYIGSSLSTGFEVCLSKFWIHMWAQAVQYLFSSVVSLPFLSMLILSLPLLGLGSKSTCLSPGFCVRRPWQYNTIFWELNLVFGFFAFFWLIVWGDRINKCGWCLAGGRGCSLESLHQIPSVSWVFYHPLPFHIN